MEFLASAPLCGETPPPPPRPPPSFRVQNRSAISLTRSLGRKPGPGISPTNRGGWGGSGATMEVRGWASISQRCHRHPRGLCLYEFWFYEQIQSEEKRKWKPWLASKGDVHLFPTFPIFGVYNLTLFQFFTVWP